MISVENADTYLSSHKLKDEWNKVEYGEIQSLLDQAESFLINTLTLRNGTTETTAFEHAVYEQVIFTLTRSKANLIHQNEGIKLFSFDGSQVMMDKSFISPMSFMLLKKYIYRKVGDIR
ncbi:hypothetical protein [Neobacillus mesonae]|uniref:hypothetical protein n=1 Tax=Neobacillus mesonae TaxID=1193713 RepID=UPI0025724367|nr:hypothetical protein [Neobacillus mesonae]